MGASLVKQTALGGHFPKDAEMLLQAEAVRAAVLGGVGTISWYYPGVELTVVASTEPTHVERPTIVIMVPAYATRTVTMTGILTRPPDKATALQCSVKGFICLVSGQPCRIWLTYPKHCGQR